MFDHNTDESLVLRSITYCEYVGPIFQSQLSSVGPDKSMIPVFPMFRAILVAGISEIAFTKVLT